MNQQERKNPEISSRTFSVSLSQETFQVVLDMATKRGIPVEEVLTRLVEERVKNPNPYSNPVVKKLERLSPRQLEVLKYLDEGKSIQGIANTMFLARSSVLYHVRKMYEKLGIEDMPIAARRMELGKLYPFLPFVQEWQNK